MKKILFILITFCILLTGCSSTEKPDEPVNEETVENVVNENEIIEENTEELEVKMVSDYFSEKYYLEAEITYTSGLSARSKGIYSESEKCFYDENVGECFLRYNSEDDETVSLKLEYGQLQAEEMVFAKDGLPVLEDTVSIKHYGPSDYQVFDDHIRIVFIEN